MKKLKQSSALLLIVSFLLSMFSFSAFAANKITVKIAPRLLSPQQQQQQAKGVSRDPGGQLIKNATFNLYKLGDLELAVPNQNYACEGDPNNNNTFPFDKNKTEHEVEIAGNKYKFYGENNSVKNAKTGNNGIATVKFNENESGWYIAIMDDAGEKTCLPTFIYVDTESSQTEQTVYPKAQDMADDQDLPSIKKYILGTNETRFVSKPGKRFINDGGDDDRTIDYQIDVGIPRINGTYKGDQGDRYGNEINDKYSIFSVTDDNLKDNPLVEGLAAKCRGSNYQVEVMPISGDDKVVGSGAFVPDTDYKLTVVGNTFTVDFKRNGQGFSDNVKKFLWANRGYKNARFRIRFSVKIKDLAKYFLEQKSKLDKNSGTYKFLDAVDKGKGKLDINNLGFQNVKEEFKKMLRVENIAKFDIQKGQNKKQIKSNKVICQFGILCVRKIDKQGNKLKGAEFDLLSAVPSSLQQSNNDYKAKWLGKGALDSKTGDRYFAFLAGKSQVLNKGDESKLSIDQINQMAENVSDLQETLYLYETKAPQGYEQIKQLITVNLSGGFNYQEVVNIPTVDMPFAGGIGTILFTVVGILLIGSGAFLYMNSRRKKSAE